MSLNVSKAKQLANAAARGQLSALGSILRLLIDELDPLLSCVSLAVSTTLNAGTHGGKNILMSGAGAARTFTLPAATGTKDKYRFTVAEVNTSSYLIKVANATDVMDGSIITVTDTASDVVVGWETASTSDTITLNGTTTGGAAIGDYVELQDIATGQWSVTGIVTGTGTEATPFSATVS
jgi:hypothetical protein